MLRSLVVLVVAGLSGAGCFAAPCTLIGCQNTLRFSLGAQAAVFGAGEAVTVTACLDDDCLTETLTRQADGGISGGTFLWLDWSAGTVERQLATIPSSGAHRASVTLTKAGTTAFQGTVTGVTFTTNSPNGPGCAPTCATATASF